MLPFAINGDVVCITQAMHRSMGKTLKPRWLQSSFSPANVLQKHYYRKFKYLNLQSGYLIDIIA